LQDYSTIGAAANQFLLFIWRKPQNKTVQFLKLKSIYDLYALFFEIILEKWYVLQGNFAVVY